MGDHNMFISFEGIDGSGKSTQIKLLADRLQAGGQAVHVFREPGGTALSERIRALLLDPAYDINAFSELLLFSAARAQLVVEQIRPALEKGGVVICDRFFDSTLAYQGAGRSFGDMDWLVDFQRRVTNGLVPLRTYLLDVPVSVSVDRRLERASGEATDRMEEGGAAFYKRVVAAYENIARQEPDRVLVLDGTQSVEDLHEQIWADINNARLTRVGTRV